MFGGFRDGGVACPAGLACDVSCDGGGKTRITGKVYDPAGKNALYNVAVYVPRAPLVALPKGVPTGSEACSCGALFKSGAVVSTATAADGSFTLSNVPVGHNVPLVLQAGKWRKSLHVDVTACQDNAQPDKSLKLPSSVAVGDTDDNMPDIAVSTGAADTLECLMRRIGLPESEYVAGSGSSGHVHVFSGGTTNVWCPPGGGGGSGCSEEVPTVPGAPDSPTYLWANQKQLMPYDVTLLSCEGEETYSANPPALEAYLNAGGRVFASHYQYAWFAPITGNIYGAPYVAPPDWGANLASWNDLGGVDGNAIGGVVVTTLNGSGMPFPKGVALQQWMHGVGALGQYGVSPGEVSIFDARYNAFVGPGNKASQPWINADATSGYAGATMYFSFNTPVNAPLGPDGNPLYCGRAVFSDLHAGGAPSTHDTLPPPGGCLNADLSPQEKVLEFMLFDLSSCVIPDTVAPSNPILQ